MCRTCGLTLLMVLVVSLCVACRTQDAAAPESAALMHALARVEVLGAWSAAERDLLKGIAVLHYIEAGERIIEQGTRMGRMYTDC